MHGLINRTIQLFVTNTQGADAWRRVVRAAGLPFTDFEGMMRYKEQYTPRVLEAATEVLGRDRAELLEDIGTFIVSDAAFEPVRRLLRFGGIDFVDFLHSLDDLHERVRLAVSDLVLPRVELRAHAAGQFSLICQAPVEGYGHVMMGLLRAMADDYGALVLLEHLGNREGAEVLSIRLVEADFAEGRRFELGASVA